MVARVLRVDLVRVRISAPRYMLIKLILFDFFGTLAFLSQKPSFQDLLYFFKKADFSLKEATQIANSFLSSNFWDRNFRNWADFVRAVLSHWDKELKEEVIQEAASFLEKNVIFKYYEDVKDIKNLPVKKAIFTTAPRFLLKGLPLIGFEKIFTPENTKFLKPDLRAFLVVLKDLGVSPDETLMVGDDLERDILPAGELGIKTVLIDRENKIKDSSVRKIHSLVELKQILT